MDVIDNWRILEQLVGILVLYRMGALYSLLRYANSALLTRNWETDKASVARYVVYTHIYIYSSDLVLS
jgi:hypothetical protein